jgi:hypothetical protein
MGIAVGLPAYNATGQRTRKGRGIEKQKEEYIVNL